MKYLVQFNIKAYACEYCEQGIEFFEASSVKNLKKQIREFIVELYSDIDDPDWKYIDEMVNEITVYEIGKKYAYGLEKIK